MASEIRVDKINSLSGVGTVTLSPTGVDIAGITTAATLRATTGIVTSLTAGSLTSLGAVSGTTGTFSAAVSGTTGTFSGAVSGTTGTFTGDVDIADKIVHTGDTDTAIRFSGADTISAETGGSERARIDSTGRVRIGCTAQPSTTVSGAQFDAGGKTLRISEGGGTSSTTGSSVQIIGGGGNTSIGAAAAAGAVLSLTNCNNTDNNQTSVEFSASSGLSVAKVVGKNDSHSSRNGSLIFLTSSGAAPAERLRINSSGTVSANGKLLVGTTAEAPYSTRLLTVGDTSFDDTALEIRSSSTTGRLYFTDSASAGVGAYQGELTFDHTSGNNRMHTKIGGTTVISVTTHGLTFNGDTADTNALDDYEEGAWTMTAQQGADSVTQNSANQRYTKIGNLVTVVGEVNGLTNSTSAVFTIAGLPYTVATGREGAGSAFSNNVTFPSGYNGITVYTYAGHDRLRFYVSKTGGAWHGVQGNEIGAGDIIFSVTYFTN